MAHDQRSTSEAQRVTLVPLDGLIRRHLEPVEDENTRRLMVDLSAARIRGHVTPGELERVCYWKSPRAIHHVRANSAAFVRRVTALALRTRDEQARMRTLLALRGVSVPMGSALLTLLFPRRYAVIDIRVWQLLFAEGAVSSNPAGRGLSVEQWCEFLAVTRAVAARLGGTPRTVERTLFEIHRRRQVGTLYGVRR
jgi:hypothetical protein